MGKKLNCVKFAAAVCAAGLFFTVSPMVRADHADSQRDYVRDAYAYIIGDAAINRVARDKAEHGEVRHYADERVKMDERMEHELRDIADRHHIGVVGRDEVSRDAQDKLERLRTSEHFDHEYLGGEVDDSKAITRLFRDGRDAEEDPEIKHFFDEKYPTLKDRDEEVKTLADKYDR
jgi:predicted outer membrane protein